MAKRVSCNLCSSACLEGLAGVDAIAIFQVESYL